MGDTNKTIEQILLNIKQKEIRTMKSIVNERNLKIDEVVDDFMCYPKNQENIKQIKEKLEDYELITIDQLYKYDTILYIDMYYFYDFELSKIKVLRFEPNGKIHVKRMSSGKNNVYKTIDIPSAIFRKLTEEDKVKINLVETIYNMKR